MDDYTPLMVACEIGNRDAVERLLAKKADCNRVASFICSTRSSFSRTSTWNSTRLSGEEQLVTLLIGNGAIPDTYGNILKETPLYTASKWGHLRIVEILLNAGAKTSILDSFGWTPLMTACEGGHLEVVRLLLLREADPNLAAADGLTPLLIAVRKGHFQLTGLLLSYKANPNLPTKQYQAALDVQKIDNRLEEKLKEEGASLTPLTIACENGQLELANLLLTHQANPNQARADGATPLHLAAQKSYFQIATLLLAHNADPKQQDKAGLTPLDVATDRKIIRLLKKSKDAASTNKREQPKANN